MTEVRDSVATAGDLLDDLRWRGLLHQVTDETVARAALADSRVRAYIGFDPTAASLHVGSLLQIMMLCRLARAGHQPIFVIGGGTGMIGDPSGKSQERTLLDDATVGAHAAAITAQIRDIYVRAAEDAPFVAVDNADWLGQAQLIEFLRDVGKYFSVNAMIQRDSVRTRLDQREQGISFTEFSYMLLQAYDFLELYRRYGCRAQFGGSDQWGNIASGIDLIHRLCPDDPMGAPFGLTVPLVTTKSGQKFGKTEAGAIWLDANMTSPFQFFQFWINTDDADVSRYLRSFTFLDHKSIEALEGRHALAPENREAQRTLALEVTTLVHGEMACKNAELASSLVFGTDRPDDAGLPAAEVFAILAAEIPTAHVTAEPGPVPQQLLLVGEDPGFAFRSNGEAKRALLAGSVSINGFKLSADLREPLDRACFQHDRFAVVRVGKKQRFLVVVD